MDAQPVGGVTTDRESVRCQRVPDDRIDLERLAIDVILPVEHPRSLHRHRRDDEIAPRHVRTVDRDRHPLANECLGGCEVDEQIRVGRVGHDGDDVDVAVRHPVAERHRTDDVQPFDHSGRDLVVCPEPRSERLGNRSWQEHGFHGPNLATAPTLDTWPSTTN